MPPLDGATQWLNSEPLTAQALQGKVVVIDFWTYSCINCIRALPFVKAWYEKYRDQGLVVIGIHSPEFAFEKNLRNVRREVRRSRCHLSGCGRQRLCALARVREPVLARALFRRRGGQHSAHAFRRRRVRRFGARDPAIVDRGGTHGRRNGPRDGRGRRRRASIRSAAGAEPRNVHRLRPRRAFRLGRRTGARTSPRDYTVPARLGLNDWALDGNWTVRNEDAVLNGATGRIVFRFQARDLHLVLGPAQDGEPVRFRVRVDGAAPGSRSRHRRRRGGRGDGRRNTGSISSSANRARCAIGRSRSSS